MIALAPAVPQVHPRPAAQAAVVFGAPAANPYAETVGLGVAHPGLIYLGQGPASEFTRVRWRSWGAAVSRASATGRCMNKRGAAHTCGVTLVAENLGPCHGVTAYRTLVASQGGQTRRYGICTH